MRFSKLVLYFLILFNFVLSKLALSAGKAIEYPDKNWSFSSIFGTFDKASAQRGFQVYKEVCAGCHGMRLISYRNLAALGYNQDELKAIASQFEITDGPNDDGEFFTRPGRPSDKFASPYPNKKAAIAANGGAYPPDMSVLVKARGGGANYIYSVLMGYDEPPAGMELDDGVYYNKYMYGNKIKMASPLDDDIVEYSDGTKATVDQMAKDVTTFLQWTAEPHLEARHKLGFRVIIYLSVLTILVYFSMKKIWSRIETKV